MPSTPPQSNSILNLLNPYSSMARSTVPTSDPESPSTLLLRELTGDDGGPDDDGQPSAERKRSRERKRGGDGDRERMSPTPTPATFRPTHVVATSDDDDDDDAPPRSIIYGGPDIPYNPIGRRKSGERTPKSTQGPLPTDTTTTTNQPMAISPDIIPRATSPGPFRLGGPPSSSASGRSGSTSPGPSTMSIYASGMETTNGQSTFPNAASQDPSSSPEQARSTSIRSQPTFREVNIRPGPPSRNASSSSKKKPRASLVSSQGKSYLVPSIPPPSDKGKGKSKAREKGGRRYISVPAQDAHDEDEDEDEEGSKLRGRLAGFAGIRGGALRKTGLNEYEKALWKWVNVEDLDGFLQEVSCLPFFLLFLSANTCIGIRVL